MKRENGQKSRAWKDGYRGGGGGSSVGKKKKGCNLHRLVERNCCRKTKKEGWWAGKKFFNRKGRKFWGKKTGPSEKKGAGQPR